ncbi:MAG: hypothetical protein VX772_08095 [Bacteroidota bacterium]|uniref:Uncharacterized protein n=1 Tax=Flagellimonas okinawensis TaxID=3031324 RepID=A0ABT5XIN8_9FLAO|nr:hypothetical protein [[Muricauda] okinawensis]MDF0705752.1 hypothetical protein [[Muricauda] okinawensis]MEC8832307.1 hypothetical protein [Bacteroidota bacterium]
MENTIHYNTEQQQELLVRVERNNRMVQRLSQKLNSYTCQPKCPQQFEKFYELNKSIENFKKHQKHIMSKIRQRKMDFSDAVNNEVGNQLDRFKKLEKDFASYLTD